MGRRGRAAGGPSRGGNNGIILEFAKPSAPAASSSTTQKKPEIPTPVKPFPLPRSASASPIFADEAEHHYEKCSSNLCDKDHVLGLVNYWNKGTQRRKELLTLNTNPNYEEFEALRRAKKLDATLKRCSAFVKKLKNCSGSQAEAVEKEIEVLNLTKYLSEICAAVTDNRLKDRNHVWEILSICSKLHQRYPDFSASLLEVFKGKFNTKTTDPDWNILGGDLRLLTECMICGILGDEAFPLIQIGLRQLVASRDTSAHMNIMLSYVKDFGLDFAGIFPKGVQILCDTYSISKPSSDLVSPQKQQKIKLLVNEYMNNVCTSLSKLHEEMNKSQLICRKLLKTKGEVLKDREDIHKDLVANFERLHTFTKKLAFYTDIALPELQELPPDEDDEDIPNMSCADVAETDTSKANRATFFDDEEIRSFYQDIPELSKYLTNAARRENTMLLEQQAAALAAAEASVDVESEIAELQSDEALVNASAEPDMDQDLADTSISMENLALDEERAPPKFAEFIGSLRHCVNRNMVDAAAEMFMANFNNKPNRKRLIKEICHIPRQRVDLLPLWARLVAVLNPVVPEVGAEVTTFLKKELWILLKRCHPTFIENKLKISRFLAELTNFEVLPHIDAFNTLRRLLSNFVNHELEMCCAFVECCGRYLIKNPATKRRMKLYMDLMQRKKQAKVLNPRHIDLVEQAFLVVFPPEGRKVKPIPIMQKFLEDHVYSRLKWSTIGESVELLRALNLKDPESLEVVHNIFTQPWHIANNRLDITCGLLARLEDYQPTFVNNVADTVMVEVNHGIGHIHILNNQFMVSLINYVCDLFCYQIYSCETILQLMYCLISKGVSSDYKKPSKMDPPRSSFRLRLVTVLLKGCGDYFLDDKVNRMKLYIFIIYLQRYMYFKSEDPVWQKAHTPYSYEPFQVVEDLIRHLFPKKKTYQTYELACEKVKKLEKKLTKEATAHQWFPQPSEERGSRVLSNRPSLHKIHECDEMGDEMRPDAMKWMPTQADANPNSIGSESVAEPFFASNYNAMTVENRSQYLHGDFDELNPEELDDDETMEATPEEGMEFDRQLGMLFSNAVVQREARVINSDIRIPLHLEKNTQGKEAEEQPSGTISYAILLKKGNKPNIKHVDVPEASEFVKRMRDREAIEREERAQIKAKTLGIKQLQDKEELMEIQRQFQFSTRK